MSTQRGPSGGSWAVMRCRCCAEDNVTWLPDGHTVTDADGVRLYPQGVVLMPDARVGVRWSYEFPDDRAVEILRTTPIAGTTEGTHHP